MWLLLSPSLATLLNLNHSKSLRNHKGTCIHKYVDLCDVFSLDIMHQSIYQPNLNINQLPILSLEQQLRNKQVGPLPPLPCRLRYRQSYAGSVLCILGYRG